MLAVKPRVKQASMHGLYLYVYTAIAAANKQCTEELAHTVPQEQKHITLKETHVHLSR